MATKTKNCEYKMTIENALKQLKKIEKTVSAEQEILKHEIEEQKGLINAN